MDKLTHSHLAWEFAELFEDFDSNQINEVLANNVPFETLEFFGKYATDFSDAAAIKGELRKRVPNLLILGYLLRVLEERLIVEEDEPSAQ